MKKTFLTLSLFLTATITFAQDKGFVSVNFGSSIPIGEFASTDENSNSAGYAQTGFLVDVSLGLKFSKHFGVNMLVREQVNKYDAQALADQTKESGVSSSINTTAWTMGGYMVGCYGSFPISKIFTIEPRIMVGYSTATSPNITINVTDGTTSAWAKVHSASSGSFSYLIGVGYRINAGKSFCFSFNADYLGANPEFSNVVTTYSWGDKEVGTMSQNIETINLSFGIGFRFGTQKNQKKLTINDL